MYFMQGRSFHYEYAPIGITASEFVTWEEQMMDKNADTSWMANIYWKLDQVSCVLVLRNPLWFQAVVHKFDEAWRIIERERVSGEWRARLPTRSARDALSTHWASDSPYHIDRVTHLMRLSSGYIIRLP